MADCTHRNQLPLGFKFCESGSLSIGHSCTLYRLDVPFTPFQGSAFSFVTTNSSKQLSVAAVQLWRKELTDFKNLSRGGYAHAHVLTHM